jgi:hypothetical protein
LTTSIKKALIQLIDNLMRGGSHPGFGLSHESQLIIYSILGFTYGGGGIYIGQPRARGKIDINREFWALHGPGPKGLNMPGVEQAGDSGVGSGDSGLDRRLRSISGVVSGGGFWLSRAWFLGPDRRTVRKLRCGPETLV